MLSRNASRDILFGLLGAGALGALSTFYVSSIIYGTSGYPTNPHSPNERQRAHNSHENEGALGHWLTDDASGFFTLWLVVVGLGQAGLFFWQLRLISAGLVDAKDAADASAQAATAAVRQAKVAEETLLKRERPWLFAFGVQYPRKETISVNPWYIEFSLGNYGLMPCVIDSAAFDVMISKSNSDIAIPGVVSSDHPVIANGVIGPGEKRDRLSSIIHDSLAYEDNGVLVIFGDGSIPVPKFNITDDERVVFRLIVKYHGPFSAGHRTEASWVYDGPSCQFIPWGGDKYNYTK